MNWKGLQDERGEVIVCVKKKKDMDRYVVECKRVMNGNDWGVSIIRYLCIVFLLMLFNNFHDEAYRKLIIESLG